MTTIIWIVSAVVVLSIVFAVLLNVARTYVKMRGRRLVTCPETREPAGVELDAAHAALGKLTGGSVLRLKACNRWPERQGCGQECLTEVEAAPEGCLVRTILSNWYEGKNCAFCGKPFGEINWHDHKPALMNPEHVTLEWSEVPAEKVPTVLDTHMPVCWNCHIIETFRRRYPQRVVDRPWKPGESHRSM
ncbi:MAG TPA: hypothetical protein VE131_09150 [Terriglobales bacterium]|nr:hypothetical protein [Terriglobales bacterium]